MRKGWLVFFALVVIAGVLLWARRRPPSAPDMAARARRPARAAGEPRRPLDRPPGIALPTAAAIDLTQWPLPRSLEGTEVPPGLAADENGHLRLGPGVLAVFDYFLSAAGEEPPAVIRARILAAIAERLPPAAARAALELLDRYLEYRERGRELWAAAGDADDLDRRLEVVRALRREVFGDDVADALFGEQEAEDFVAAAQREIARDESIPEEERRRRIEALEQQLPEPVREARAEALKPLRWMEEERQLRAAGGTAPEVRALRERYFGAEAADRLEALDRETAEWDRRIAEYRAARAAIESDPSLAPDVRASAIEALRAERFSDTERLRVDALDRLAAEQAAAPAAAGPAPR
jgi:lipase chaperone LimK